MASSGNVFADLGLSSSEEKQAKVKIAFTLNQILDAQGGTQQQIAQRLRIDQPKVSALRNYKLEGLSVERLLGFLTALNFDVDINVKRPKRRRARSGRLTVHLAA